MRRLVLLAVCAAAVAGCGSSAEDAPQAVDAPKARFAGAEITPPRTAPPIVLHDAAGRRVTLAAQRGRYVLVTFLYTHCPDVCPLIAQNLNAALRALTPAARNGVRVLAVSVDPVGDTPAAVRRFARVHALLPQFRYLIGTRAQLRPVWNAWSVIAVQRKPKLVTHAAYTALVDPRGKERVFYDSQVKAAAVVHDLRLLMRA